MSDSDSSERRGRVGRSTLNPFDARAIEEAVRILEAQGNQGEVVLVAAAAPPDLAAVRDGLARGAHRALFLDDLSIDQRDVSAVATTLASLLSSEAPDCVLLCYWPGDIEGALLASAIGEILDMPVMTQARSVVVGEGDVTVQKQVEGGDLTQRASLPCVIDLAEAINKPRYPTMKGKIAAKSKPVALAEAARIVDGSLEPRCSLLGISNAPRTRKREIFQDAATGIPGILQLLDERELL